MKKILFLLLALLLAAAVVYGLVFAYRAMQAERAAEGSEAKPVATASRVKRAANGDRVVVLDPETRQRVGLASSPLEAVSVPKEIRVYGKVLDISGLAPMVTELRTHQISVELAEKELARLKQLHQQGQNASLRSVEAAEAELQKAQAARQGVRDRLALAWGKIIADEANLDAFLQSLTSWQKALVRLDLLPGETVGQAPPTALLALQADETNTVTGTYFDTPTTQESALPVQSFVYLVKDTRWAPGTRVIGRLKSGQGVLSGVLMPHRAVVRDNGRSWVFVQQSEDTFQRRPVTLDQPVPGGWLVNGDWRPGQRVVTTRAQLLLSEELKAQIKLVD